MRCEVVAIGTELLLGQIVDTNSAWIGEQLAQAGIDCYGQSTVGDNLDRIVATVGSALERSDAVICCGGLGPTQDDLTREALARLMGVRLLRDEQIEERIIGMFSSRGRRMPANNLRQADVPDGASLIDQQPGTAPGLVCPVGDKVVYAVPGVPAEMRQMLTGTVIADLRRRAGAPDTVIRSRTVRSWGLSESHLAELLGERIAELDASPRATLAFLASGWDGLKVRVTAKAPSEAEADAVLEEEVAAVADALGEHVFSTTDESMEAVVLDLLAERGLSIATAESVTGGLVAARLTEAPGASETVRGGVVSYAAEVKHEVLGVPEGPVVTEEAARAMAAGACTVLGADVGVATTGVAGPEPAEGVPVGVVCLATCVDGESRSLTIRLPGDRDQIRQFSVISVLDLLRRRLRRASAES